MKLWKILIRIWLTLASVASFVVGWVALAHAPKPNQFKPSSIQAAPKLDPVPSLDQVMSTGGSETRSFLHVQSAQPVQQMPMLRSGGS